MSEHNVRTKSGSRANVGGLSSARIPSGWEVKKLRELVSVDPESLKKGTPPDYAFKYIEISRVITGAIDIPAEQVMLKDAPTSAKRVIKRGDVLISKVRPNLQAFVHFDEEGDGWVATTGFAVLRCKKNADSRFIYNAMLSDDITRQINQRVEGSTYPTISSSNIKELTLLFPPLSEQRKIAAVLTSVDEVMARVQKQINKLQDLKKATMEELLSEGVNHGKAQKEWTKVQLGKIGKLSTSSVNKKSDATEQAVSLLNYMDVYNHSVLSGDYPFQKVTAPNKQILSAAVKSGDVFFTPSSETPDDIGVSAVFLGEVKNLVHSYHTVRFRPSSKHHLDDSFKAYAFKGEATHEYFRRRATGSTRFTLSLPDFRELEVCLPPLPEQRKIAAILSSMDSTIEEKQRKLRKLQSLKNALMQDLLAGKIRT